MRPSDTRYAPVRNALLRLLAAVVVLYPGVWLFELLGGEVVEGFYDAAPVTIVLFFVLDTTPELAGVVTRVRVGIWTKLSFGLLMLVFGGYATFMEVQTSLEFGRRFFWLPVMGALIGLGLTAWAVFDIVRCYRHQYLTDGASVS
jgi:hypothetical protein